MTRNHVLTVRLIDTVLSNAVQQSVRNLSNEYVKFAAMTENGSDTVIHLTMSSDSIHYNAKQYQMYDQQCGRM